MARSRFWPWAKLGAKLGAKEAAQQIHRLFRGLEGSDARRKDVRHPHPSDLTTGVTLSDAATDNKAGEISGPTVGASADFQAGLSVANAQR